MSCFENKPGPLSGLRDLVGHQKMLFLTRNEPVFWTGLDPGWAQVYENRLTTRPIEVQEKHVYLTTFSGCDNIETM